MIYFTDYFKYQNPGYMYEKSNSTKNKEKNKIQLGLIISALTYLKNAIKYIPEN